MRELDLAKSAVVVALLLLRGLPHLFTGAVKPSRRLGIDEIVRAGFVVLGEEPDRELVLGVVGRFWRPTSAIRRIDPREFVGFDTPGYAKAAWNFLVEGASGGSTIVTETRIACTDVVAGRKFARYWRLVGPFSALIRRRVLRLIRRDAERRVRRSPSPR